MRKQTKILAAMMLGLALMSGASAQTSDSIDSFVTGQDVNGQLTTEATVSHDYYYEDFDVSLVYGQWAILDITEVNPEDPTNLTSEEINNAEIVRSGSWEDLQPVGNSFADYGENDVATESVSYTHDFNFENPDTGEYALMTIMATADSVYDPDANHTDGEGWTQSSAEWSAPEDETYGYDTGTYGIKEIDRTLYPFRVVEATEPQGVGNALQNFWDSIFGGIVESLTSLFENNELGVPNPDSPPSPS